jgi:hypothetical protein
MPLLPAFLLAYRRACLSTDKTQAAQANVEDEQREHCKTNPVLDNTRPSKDTHTRCY